MPTLRSRAQEPVAPVMKQSNESTQWVMIAPNSLTENEESDGSLYKMPHPQNGIESLFLFKEKRVYQLMKYKESYRSWFIDTSVQKDGTVLMVTPFDPLFLALPYLRKYSDKYTSLDNILIDEKYSAALLKLEESLTKANLLNICNCKEYDDIVVYKPDDSKILAWLSLKVQKLADHFSKSNIYVGSGARSNNFKDQTAPNEQDCLRYAWSIVSDYITVDWSDKVKENLNITDVIKHAKKKQKLNDSTASEVTCNKENSTGVVEDYRDKDVKKKAVPVKMTSAQKQLAKVNKKGMKTMSSFFTSKPKK